MDSSGLSRDGAQANKSGSKENDMKMKHTTFGDETIENAASNTLEMDASTKVELKRWYKYIIQ